MKKLLAAILFAPVLAHAQLVIPATTTIAGAADTEVGIESGSDVTNNSTNDFSGMLVNLTLTGSTQNIKGNFILAGLSLAGDGPKNFNGNITVTKSLGFANGYILPTSNTNKFLFIGPADGITGANESSFFDCSKGDVFYSSGDGARLYPIGLLTEPVIYSPASLERITAETGMSVVRPANSFVLDTAELASYYQDRYWSITPVNASTVDGTVQLDIQGINLTSPDDNAVWQAASTSDLTESIGSSTFSATSITSREKVTAGFVGIGTEKTFVVKVRDLITPTGSLQVNDKLYIENIEKFDYKKVTLLDRWGYIIKVWDNYTNAIDYDFTKLGAGNYIVVAEYGNAGAKPSVIQQMVTVLKTN